MFPAEVTELNDWVSFARREGTVYSFKGPRPVFSHAEPDQASFRMFTSPWVIKGNCTQAEIVRALGISVISLKRSVKPYRPQGAAGFFKSRAARQPRVLTSAVRQKAQELIQQGTRPPRGGPRTGGQIRHVAQGPPGRADPRLFKKSEAVADKSPRSVLDSQAALGLGCVRVEERVWAALGGLREAPTRFEPGREVSCGGVLWALPALLANGWLHRPAECFELPKGFYGVVQVRLLMGFLALARIKSLERLRFEPPGEWGHWLGLDRIPEVPTLRAKLGQRPKARRWNPGVGA